jgi:hypothetical protein
VALRVPALGTALQARGAPKAESYGAPNGYAGERYGTLSPFPAVASSYQVSNLNLLIA